MSPWGSTHYLAKSGLNFTITAPRILAAERPDPAFPSPGHRAALLNKYRSVLFGPKLTKLHGLTEAEVDVLLVELTANAVWRDPEPSSPAPDRGDDHLWALLDAYAGSILITGDRLLQEHSPARSSVISPTAWLNNFASSERPTA